MNKEDIELAEEHIKLAEEIVLKEAKNVEVSDDASEEQKESIKDAAVSLERAESDLEKTEE